MLMLAACGGGTSSAWQAYQQAEAVPGQGFGDLRLGTQRMGGLIDQFGVERVGGWFSDEENGIELIYSSVGLHFMFPLEGECAQATRSLGHRMIREMYQPDDFLARYPACRDLTLDAILIASGSRSAWWEGATHRGSRLGDLWPEVMARHGTPLRHGPVYLAQAANASLESLLYEEGAELYFRSLGSDEASTPERLLMPLTHIRLFRPYEASNR
ncbi:MAG: hypothetical protein EA370_16210 [Wenzhouxiangella sp.]|nr:MAG: hypothetical protein EA370_16210 [Wenzhouxiangella sp.]